MGGDTEGDARNESGSSVDPMESLVYDDLIEGIEGVGMFWPNPVPAPNGGQHTGQAPDGLVFSLFFHATILSNCLRDCYYAFYDDFLNQISGLAGRSPHRPGEGGAYFDGDVRVKDD